MQNNIYDITSGSVSRDVTVGALFKKVYLWMTFALAITGVCAWAVASNPSVMYFIFNKPALLVGLFIAELVLVGVLSARILSLSYVTAATLFFIYSVINGVVLSSVFVVYELGTISSAFFTCAGMFAVMSFIGFVTKKDLSSLGRVFLMLLVGLIIATIVNIFVASDGLYWAITYIGVILFCGLTVYDVFRLKRLFADPALSVEEEPGKFALLGALSLYLDFINIFLYLLRIFGSKK